MPAQSSLPDEDDIPTGVKDLPKPAQMWAAVMQKEHKAMFQTVDKIHGDLKALKVALYLLGALMAGLKGLDFMLIHWKP
jgi:hypothetical protein